MKRRSDKPETEPEEEYKPFKGLYHSWGVEKTVIEEKRKAFYEILAEYENLRVMCDPGMCCQSIQSLKLGRTGDKSWIGIPETKFNEKFTAGVLFTYYELFFGAYVDGAYCISFQYKNDDDIINLFGDKNTDELFKRKDEVIFLFFQKFDKLLIRIKNEIIDESKRCIYINFEPSYNELVEGYEELKAYLFRK